MLSEDNLSRMLDAANFNDAAKIVAERGYPDMSGLSIFQVESVLAKYRADVYDELAKDDSVSAIVDLFRMKYDFHNVKTAVKALAVGTNSDSILSDCGRVPASAISETVKGGDNAGLLPDIAEAIQEASGILARTSNPRLSDTAIDRIYFSSLLSGAEAIKNTFIVGYVKLLIDAANLRIFVRSKRTGRSAKFASFISGGNIPADEIAVAYDNDNFAVFSSSQLSDAVKLAEDAAKGGTQTRFERECENAISEYCSDAKMTSFGAEVVVQYLTELDWEITAVRMILAGKQSGVEPSVIKERLRERYV